MIDWQSFTPWQSAAGGVMVGVSAAMLLLLNGRIAGVSGITAGLLKPPRGDWPWRFAFVAGLVIAPLLYAVVAGPVVSVIDTDYSMLALAGFIVGVGTRYGSGCTSGHGVCGLSRLSPNSLVATLCFMGSGFAAVFVLRHLI